MKFLACFLLLIVLLCAGLNEAARCIERMSSKSGSFTSPRFPLKYPPSTTCTYIVKANLDHYIEITFSEVKLELPRKGKKNDYIMISDGWREYRQNVVRLDGSTKSPYTFLSATSRVTIKFVSNKLIEDDGFRATYKFIKREGCPNLEVLHGQSKCNFNRKGVARRCEISCDQNFKLQGKKLTYCQNGTFFNPPSCVPDPASFCNISNWEEFNPTCLIDQSNGIKIACKYTCKRDYLPVNNGIFVCADGSRVKQPDCVADPVKMNLCNLEPNSLQCPFSPEEIAQYQQKVEEELNSELEAQLSKDMEMFGDDIKFIQPEPLVITANTTATISPSELLRPHIGPRQPALAARRTTAKKSSCPRYLCYYNREEQKFKYSCQLVVKKIQKKRNLTDNQAKQLSIDCHKCQEACGMRSLFQ